MTAPDPRRLRGNTLNYGYRDGSADRPTGRDGRYSTAGENSRGAKLTEAQVLDILARPRGAGGQSDAAVAAEYGVGKATVTRIRSGKAWGHLRVERDGLEGDGERAS